MKKWTFVFTAGLFMMAACNNQKTEPVTTVAAAQNTVALPFTAGYSSSFEMGKPEHSALILQGSWKDWEDNKIDDMKRWVADTVIAFHSDNNMVKGVDSLMANWKAARAKYSSVIDTIDAVIPVYSIDKKENWVLVWAKSINTKLDGSKDTTELMETWRINKDGKADFLLQYDRRKRK